MAKRSKRTRSQSATATTASDKLCFAVMPFGGWNDTYYQDIVVPAANDAGLRPRRADQIYGPSSIIDDIWRNVRKATVVVAELTGRNANVFYELGLAHALGKPVILMTQLIADVPFDLQGLRVLVYDLQDPGWASKLRDGLTTAMRQVLDRPERFVPAPFLKIIQRSSTAAVAPLEQRLLGLEQSVELMRTMLTERVAQQDQRWWGNTEQAAIRGLSAAAQGLRPSARASAAYTEQITDAPPDSDSPL